MADRASVRLVLALSTQLGLPPYLVDISASFLHEPYCGKQPLYVSGIPNFDRKLTRDDTLFQMVKNIFGKTFPRCYADGPKRHLEEIGTPNAIR